MEKQTMSHLKLPTVSSDDDALYEMMQIQRVINSRFYDNSKLGPNEKEKFLKEYCLAITAESMELLDLINWKIWKQTKKEVEWQEVKYEAIDMLHFVLSLFDVLGMSKEDVHAYYLAKANENLNRQNRGY